MHPIYHCHQHSPARPLVMGILNITPDSFSDGGQFIGAPQAISQAKQMIEEGVDIIDVGGESTRPGAADVSLEDELNRVLPVIEAIAPLGKPVSVDTSKAEVMRAAVSAGAAMINDVRALQNEGALEAAVECQVPVCLMHMQGLPRSMQQSPEYRDVCSDVISFLKSRVEQCEQAGLSRELICVDPGFGFGKTLEHNIALLRQLSALQDLGLPVLAGLSRKSMLGQITGREVNERLASSLAVALIAAFNQASIIRVHDVKETLDVMKVYAAVSANH